MENTNQTNMFGGLLIVKKVIDNPDGSATVVFEADKDFRKGFKEYYSLKRWSQKRFNKFMNEAIESSIKYYKAETERNEKVHGDENN